MKIASILENQKIEKRIAITPEIAKKYISLGFKVLLPENYGSHLGIKDEEYKELGVSISKDENEIISSAEIIVQLGLLDDDKSSLLKESQTFIGVLNPYNNKDKINNLVKKNINIFSLELLPRITRAQSMDILSSQANLAGYNGSRTFAILKKQFQHDDCSRYNSCKKSISCRRRWTSSNCNCKTRVQLFCYRCENGF